MCNRCCRYCALWCPATEAQIPCWINSNEKQLVLSTANNVLVLTELFKLSHSFTFMLLAMLLSEASWIAFKVHIFFQFMYSLRINPSTLALLVFEVQECQFLLIKLEKTIQQISFTIWSPTKQHAWFAPFLSVADTYQKPYFVFLSSLDWTTSISALSVFSK